MIKSILCGVLTLTLGVINMNTFDNVSYYFSKTTQINIICDNNYIACDKKLQDVVIDSLQLITTDSHQMPAYGVSIDHETRECMKSGLWLELYFDGEQIFEDMPFERLLISVNPSDMGFNLIRYHDEVYDGRCFHLSLKGTTKPLYDTLLNIVNNT